MTNVAASERDWRAIGDTTFEVFEAELRRVNSPMLATARATYEAAKPHSALFLAQAWMENQYKTTGHFIKPHHNNPTAMRPPAARQDARGNHIVEPGPHASGFIFTAAGYFLTFRSDADAAREWRRRIDTEGATYKGGVYARTKTLNQYLGVYAPAGDVHPVTGLDNADIGYYESVMTKLRAFAAKEGTQPTTPTSPAPVPAEDSTMASHRFILSAGHRNTDGGGASREIDWTYGITKQLRDAIHRRGGKAWIVSEHDGDNDPSFSVGRGLQNAARRCVELAPTFGPFDAYISMHYEGGPARGFFGIVPDGSGDTWAMNTWDVELARMIANHVAKTGMPKRTVGVREPGIMSEKQTGVGAQGYRLGEFVGTLGFRETTVRLILEGGNYGTQADRDMLWSPAWQAKYVEAIVDGLEEKFGKFKGASTPSPAPAPPADTRRPVVVKMDLPFREANGFAGKILGTAKAGTAGRVVSGPVAKDGMNWFQVELAGMGTGWIPQGILWGIELG